MKKVYSYQPGEQEEEEAWGSWKWEQQGKLALSAAHAGVRVTSAVLVPDPFCAFQNLQVTTVRT